MMNGHLIETVLPQHPDLRVIRADVAALTAHWPWLRQKLLVIKRNTEFPEAKQRPFGEPKGEMLVKGRIRWIPEQVRHAIMRGILKQNSVELFFFVGPDYAGRDDEIKGFAITTCDLDPFLQAPVDFIGWLGWCKPEPRMAEAIEMRLEDLARERGCTGMEHTSARMGWSRRTSKLGYRLKWVIWRKELV